ncbi:unnamed protein product [Schistosoma intercalatum]|nr:unnamed protein product [Schistosoma intercalatum]
MHLTLVQIYISTQISSAYLIIGFEITSLKDTWVMISLNPLNLTLAKGLTIKKKLVTHLNKIADIRLKQSA